MLPSESNDEAELKVYVVASPASGVAVKRDVGGTFVCGACWTSNATSSPPAATSAPNSFTVHSPGSGSATATVAYVGPLVTVTSGSVDVSVITRPDGEMTETSTVLPGHVAPKDATAWFALTSADLLTVSPGATCVL